LWAARFCKTRSLATEAVDGGHVQLNGQRVKPSREVTPGDRLDIVIGSVARTVTVTGIAERRGSAQVAATLYRESEESILARERERDLRRFAISPEADRHGRPTKRDRRALGRLREG
jgi:ribosome-associated heat shock protein Hsp15